MGYGRPGSPRNRSDVHVANACRIGWELGADILKGPYTGTPESFAPIATNAPVPIMILGGPASGSVPTVLEDVVGAMDAGSRGLIIGRSIWQTADPTVVVCAIRDIVHGDAHVEEVWSA